MLLWRHWDFFIWFKNLKRKSWQNEIKELYYYNFDRYEIDFLIKIDGDIIPIEVKSGRRTNSKSLNEYIKKYNPNYSIRISSKNFGFENNIKAVPLYAVFCINK